MPHIDLNCDLGESFGAYTIGMDEKVIPFITSANVACGFHAGDPLVMQRTVALCKQSGAAVGAHPGFPDLQGFGRRQMKLTPAEAKACVQYQIGALKAFCDAAGVPLHHVKPHGALYNMAGKDRALADAICAAVKESAPGAVLLALVLLAVVLLWVFGSNRLVLTAVHPQLASSRGVATKRNETLFTVAIAIVVTLAMSWVGLMVINSLLVLPAAASRNLARNLRQYHLLSVLSALVCGLLGLCAAYWLGCSAGATIALLLAVYFAVSFALRNRAA